MMGSCTARRLRYRIMPDANGRDLKSDIVEVLSRGPRKARFVTEVASQLARARISIDLLEPELDELERSGRAVVREQYCGDPHLVGTDLRIVALVEPRAEQTGGAQDPVASAIAAIDATWDRWLADYLSNHRCG